MLTYECAEIVLTRHGHALMMWEPVGRAWEQAVPCDTPGKLFDALLWEYDKFYSYYQLAENQGIEDYTPEIKATVDEMCRLLREKRREAEQ